MELKMIHVEPEDEIGIHKDSPGTIGCIRNPPEIHLHGAHTKIHPNPTIAFGIRKDSLAWNFQKIHPELQRFTCMGLNQMIHPDP